MEPRDGSVIPFILKPLIFYTNRGGFTNPGVFECFYSLKHGGRANISLVSEEILAFCNDFKALSRGDG